MSRDKLVAAFDLQGKWSDDIGSPFMGALMRAAARDVEAGGPTLDIVGDWPSHLLISDALPTRFGGALHAAVLLNRDLTLAALYPATTPDWRMADIWPVARAYVARDRDWLRDFIKSPPQTNETRRVIAMLPGFLEQARHGPLHLLEIGASAGLMQVWDRFRFETTSWSWGKLGGPRIDTDWVGASPDLGATVEIASRAACDQNPLDVRNPDHVLRLRAFVWADQPDRLQRLEAAITTAREANVSVERADAAEWLDKCLAAPLPEGVTAIYHSVMWQYLPQSTRDAITATIEAAGARADARHRLAWLRFESVRLLNLDGPVDQMGVDLRTWPHGEQRVLARCDAHARRVETA